MPWFHATFDRHIPSILRHGLGAVTPERNNPDCDVGVYLGKSAEIALTMMLEWWIRTGIHQGGDVPAPRDFYGSVRVIVIDDTRIRPERLTFDGSFRDSDEIRRYVGVIDVIGMPLLDIDTVTPPSHRPGGADHAAMLAAIDGEDSDAIIEMLGGPETVAGIFGFEPDQT